MPFCEKCGARLTEGATACGSCGQIDRGRPAPTPPPPPPGFAPYSGPPGQPAPTTRVGTIEPIAPPRGITRGFPGAAVPPLAATVALLATTIYAVVYSMIEWGGLGNASLFLTSAAPGVLSSPFVSYGSIEIWLNHAPFGGGWVIAIPFVALLLLTAMLASRTNTDVGGRLALGGLAGVCLVVLIVLLTALNYLLALADGSHYYYGSFGEFLIRAGGGAAIVGFAGGLLGALTSLAIPPPRATRHR